jgi:NCS1 family nucleobase:cation symporter-1
MIAYLLYHIVQLPFLFVPPEKLKYLFRAKMVVLPPVILGMVIWCAVNAGGGGLYFEKPAKIHGPRRSWQWLAGMTSITGSPPL